MRNASSYSRLRSPDSPQTFINVARLNVHSTAVVVPPVNQSPLVVQQTHIDSFTDTVSYKKLKKFKKKVQQEWDFDNPCQHCQCVYLKSVILKDRKMCCMNGYVTNLYLPYPRLEALPHEFASKLIEDPAHWSEFSAYYNNILNIASTGVENGRTNRYEQFNMDASVKLNGRTFHYIRTLNQHWYLT